MADKTMQAAIDKAGVFELHGYGRQPISDKKYDEALAIFKKNKEKNGDVWPINMYFCPFTVGTANLDAYFEHTSKNRLFPLLL